MPLPARTAGEGREPPPAPPLSGQTTTRYGGRSPATPCAPLSSGRAASARWGENGVHAGIGHDQVVDVPKDLDPPLHPDEDGDDLGVELGPGAAEDLLVRGLQRERLPIGAGGGHGVERIGDRHDARFHRDIAPRETGGGSFPPRTPAGGAGPPGEGAGERGGVEGPGWPPR